MDQVRDDLDVVMNYTNASDHVPEAEQNNRTIKERIRAAYYRLPYKAIPCMMIHYLAMVCTMKLNFVCVKGKVSQYYTSRMILNQMNLYYNKHCVIPLVHMYKLTTKQILPKPMHRGHWMQYTYVQWITYGEDMNSWTSTQGESSPNEK